MINANCCYIKKEYFISHPQLQKVLDPGNTGKQSRRTHICLRIEVDTNTFYVPLRNNLGDPVRVFGRIGYPVPSQSRPRAGLDFRHALVINDMGYIEPHTQQKLPNSQYRVIAEDYDEIRRLFQVYLRGFKKAAAKGRVGREPLFRESSLINFFAELGL